MRVVILGMASDRLSPRERPPALHEADAGDAACAIARALLLTPNVELAIVPGLAPLIAATALDLAPSKVAERSERDRTLSISVIKSEPHNDIEQESLLPFLDLIRSISSGVTIELGDVVKNAHLIFVLGDAPEGPPNADDRNPARVIYFRSLLGSKAAELELRTRLSQLLAQLGAGEDLIPSEKDTTDLADDDLTATFLSFGIVAEAALDALIERGLDS